MPLIDVNKKKILTVNSVVALGKGTCCSSFLAKAYKLSADPRAKGFVFVIAEPKQKPALSSLANFVIMGNKTPEPGFFVSRGKGEYVEADFPQWWKDEK